MYRMGIAITKSIGLAYSWKADTKKLCVTILRLPSFILYLRAISKYKPMGLLF